MDCARDLEGGGNIQQGGGYFLFRDGHDRGALQISSRAPIYGLRFNVGVHWHSSFQ